MAINKVVSSFDEAVADIFDGAAILIGGFGPVGGTPSYLISALAKLGTKNLTVIENNTGYGVATRKMLESTAGLKSPPNFVDAGILVENKQVKKAIASFAVSPRIHVRTPFDISLDKGEVEIEMVAQGTLAERIRAAKAGIGAFYTPTGPGTIIASGKETKIINGRQHVLEYAINADYALIRAHKADKWGNLVYRGTSRTFNAVMAGAAKVTIAEVDEIVEPGGLDPEAIVTPGAYVDRVVLRPGKE